jgi:hypothetical protein
MAKAKRGYKTVEIQKKGAQELTLRTSATVQNAYKHLEQLSIFDFSRVLTLIYAAYSQGKKDGARAVFEDLDAALDDIKKDNPHRLPGRPSR